MLSAEGTKGRGKTAQGENLRTTEETSWRSCGRRSRKPPVNPTYPPPPGAGSFLSSRWAHSSCLAGPKSLHLKCMLGFPLGLAPPPTKNSPHPSVARYLPPVATAPCALEPPFPLTIGPLPSDGSQHALDRVRTCDTRAFELLRILFGKAAASDVPADQSLRKETVKSTAGRGWNK